MSSPRTLGRRWGGPLTVAAALGAVASTDAQALTFSDEVPHLPHLAAGATLAFRGRVEKVDVGYVEGAERPLPYTAISLVVDEPYLGCTKGEVVVLRQMGGPLKDQPKVHWIIPGLAHFSPGEEVVVFANDRRHPFFGTYFGDYGVLRIATDQRGVRRVLNERWRPLWRTTSNLEIDPDQHCLPLRSEPNRCRLERAPRKGQDLSPEALDALVRGWVRGVAPRRPQVLANEQDRFETALGAFVRQDIKLMQRTLHEVK